MMAKRFSIAFALYWQLSLDTTSAKPFIDGLTVCRRNDPKLDECLLDVLKKAKPQLIHGDPELNLPSLDPMKIPTISIHRTLKDIRVTGELTDLTAKGASSISVKTLKIELEEKTWDMIVVIPLITFVTDFNLNISLKALNIPIFGRGQCDGIISDSVLRFHANTEDKDGKLVLNDLKVNLHLGNVEVRIVKSQNPTLAHTASQFFNANKRLVLDLVTPIAENATKDLLIRHANRILSTLEITDFLTD